MESLQEFISSKRNSNTWKHRPANSWNILVSESFSSFMSFKNLKLCTRQKLCRFLKFINLKLITYRFPEFLQLRASQTKAIQRVEKFIPTECWGCKTSPLPNLGNSNSDCVPSWWLKRCTGRNFLQWRTSPKLTDSDVWKCILSELRYLVTFQNQRKTSEHVTVYTGQKVRLQKGNNLSSSVFLNSW